jgi:hypothetical protein
VITQIAVGVVLFVLAVLYVSWTAGRLDRLHARSTRPGRPSTPRSCAGGRGPRGGRRAAPGPEAAALGRTARATLDSGPDGREALENDLSRALRAAVPVLPAGADLTELEQASTRVGLARAFHNAAVRDTRVVRLRRIPRALHLAGHRELPQYFEIDDTTVPH